MTLDEFLEECRFKPEDRSDAYRLEEQRDKLLRVVNQMRANLDWCHKECRISDATKRNMDWVINAMVGASEARN